MINLRKAETGEAKEILIFYQNVIDSIKDSEFKPKWSEYYPNLEYIQTSIEKHELYISSKDNEIIASVVLNNEFDPNYENIDWTIDAESDEVTVIHTFAIASKFAEKGIGRETFNQIKDNAIKNNRRSIRIDIIDGNIGAQKVFERFGFEHIDTVEIYHEAVGLEKFHLYEYVLEK